MVVVAVSAEGNGNEGEAVNQVAKFEGELEDWESGLVRLGGRRG